MRSIGILSAVDTIRLVDRHTFTSKNESIEIPCPPMTGEITISMSRDTGGFVTVLAPLIEGPTGKRVTQNDAYSAKPLSWTVAVDGGAPYTYSTELTLTLNPGYRLVGVHVQAWNETPTITNLEVTRMMPIKLSPPSLIRLLRRWWGGCRGTEPDRNNHSERGSHLHEAGQELLHREGNPEATAVVPGSPGNGNPHRARNLRNPDVGFPGTAAEIPDAGIRERGILHSHEQACNPRYGDELLQLRRGIDSHNPTVTPLGVA